MTSQLPIHWNKILCWKLKYIFGKCWNLGSVTQVGIFCHMLGVLSASLYSLKYPGCFQEISPSQTLISVSALTSLKYGTPKQTLSHWTICFLTMTFCNLFLLWFIYTFLAFSSYHSIVSEAHSKSLERASIKIALFLLANIMLKLLLKVLEKHSGFRFVKLLLLLQMSVSKIVSTLNVNEEYFSYVTEPIIPAV